MILQDARAQARHEASLRVLELIPLVEQRKRELYHAEVCDLEPRDSTIDLYARKRLTLEACWVLDVEHAKRVIPKGDEVPPTESWVQYKDNYKEKLSTAAVELREAQWQLAEEEREAWRKEHQVIADLRNEEYRAIMDEREVDKKKIRSLQGKLRRLRNKTAKLVEQQRRAQEASDRNLERQASELKALKALQEEKDTEEEVQRAAICAKAAEAFEENKAARKAAMRSLSEDTKAVLRGGYHLDGTPATARQTRVARRDLAIAEEKYERAQRLGTKHPSYCPDPKLAVTPAITAWQNVVRERRIHLQRDLYDSQQNVDIQAVRYGMGEMKALPSVMFYGGSGMSIGDNGTLSIEA